MGSFLDQLRQAALDEEVQFNVFLTEYKPLSRTVFAFMEGRDDPSFYQVHVGRKLPVEFNFRMYRCGTKKLVLQALRDYRTRFTDEDPRVMFLVDKDHEDLIAGEASPGDKRLFITETYSIENYLCTSDAINGLLTELLALDARDPVVVLLTEKYPKAAESFAQVMLPIMSWCVACRRRGANPPLDNLRLGDFIELTDELTCASRVADPSKLPELLSTAVGLAIVPPADEVDAVLRELTVIPAKSWIRGKYEKWWFLRVYERIVSVLRERTGRKKVKIHTSLGDGNFVEVVSARVPTPTRIRALVEQSNLALYSWLKPSNNPIVVEQPAVP